MAGHEVVARYTIDDDGIWLVCSCGWTWHAGFEPTVADLAHAEVMHLAPFKNTGDTWLDELLRML